MKTISFRRHAAFTATCRGCRRSRGNGAGGPSTCEVEGDGAGREKGKRERVERHGTNKTLNEECVMETWASRGKNCTFPYKARNVFLFRMHLKQRFERLR